MDDDEPNEWTGYMCWIDFDVERGDPPKGNTVYSSIRALKKAHPPVETCGIAEVKVTLVRVIRGGE